ncbi:MAG: hypothetical protein ACREFQ_23200, partial [Stellaceae bacterium]
DQEMMDPAHSKPHAALARWQVVKGGWAREPNRRCCLRVMPGLVPGIHAFAVDAGICCGRVDGRVNHRVKPGG